LVETIRKKKHIWKKINITFLEIELKLRQSEKITAWNQYQKKKKKRISLLETAIVHCSSKYFLLTFQPCQLLTLTLLLHTSYLQDCNLIRQKGKAACLYNSSRTRVPKNAQNPPKNLSAMAKYNAFSFLWMLPYVPHQW